MKAKTQDELKQDFKDEIEDFAEPEEDLPVYEVKQQPKFTSNVSHTEIRPLQDNYINDVYTSKLYSLEVDPLNQYNMSENQKTFIKNFTEYKSIPTAAQLTGIEECEALEYYRMASTQSEITRINLARYHRNFAGKLLSIDEVGGYLSALLMDNVPIADRLQSVNKLKVAELLLKITEMKTKVINDPTIIDTINVEEQIKNLSVSSIEQLIKSSATPRKSKEDGGEDSEKDQLISQIQALNDTELTIEEVKDLRDMSISSLVEILNSLSITKN